MSPDTTILGEAGRQADDGAKLTVSTSIHDMISCPFCYQLNAPDSPRCNRCGQEVDQLSAAKPVTKPPKEPNRSTIELPEQSDVGVSPPGKEVGPTKDAVRGDLEITDLEVHIGSNFRSPGLAPGLNAEVPTGSVSGSRWLLYSFIYPCFSGWFYRRAVEKRLISAVLFFLIFSLLLSIIGMARVHRALSIFGDGVESAFAEGDIPSITIEDGFAAVSGAQTFVFDETDGLFAISINGEIEEIDTRRYGQGFLLTRTELHFWDAANTDYQILPLTDLNDAFGNPIIIDQYRFSNLWSFAAPAIDLVSLTGLFVWHFFIRFTYLAMVGMLVWGAVSIFSKRANFGLILTTGLYANVPVIYLLFLLRQLDVRFFSLYTILITVIWALALRAIFEKAPVTWTQGSYQPFPPAAVPTSPASPQALVKVYSAEAIAGLTFFLGFPGGVVLASLNWQRLGLRNKALLHTIGLFLGTIFITVVNVSVSSQIAQGVSYVLGFAINIVLLIYLYRQMSADIDEVTAGRFETANWLVGVLICLLAIGLYFMVAGFTGGMLALFGLLPLT